MTISDAKYVVENYGFIVRGDGVVSGADFGKRIAEYYDIRDTRNDWAVDVATTMIKEVCCSAVTIRAKFNSMRKEGE